MFVVPGTFLLTFGPYTEVTLTTEKGHFRYPLLEAIFFYFPRLDNLPHVDLDRGQLPMYPVSFSNDTKQNAC